MFIANNIRRLILRYWDHQYVISFGRRDRDQHWNRASHDSWQGGSVRGVLSTPYTSGVSVLREGAHRLSTQAAVAVATPRCVWQIRDDELQLCYGCPV